MSGRVVPTIQVHSHDSAQGRAVSYHWGHWQLVVFAGGHRRWPRHVVYRHAADRSRAQAWKPVTLAAGEVVDHVVDTGDVRGAARLLDLILGGGFQPARRGLTVDQQIPAGESTDHTSAAARALAREVQASLEGRA